MTSTVRFLGTRRDLPEIYRALDLFVQPSLWEGLPLALLKAMGAGLPVVATRVSGSREAIVDGVNGCLVAPGDPEALARAILELRRHPEARRRLGDAARRTVAARYSLEAMLHRLEDLYLDLWRRGNSRLMRLVGAGKAHVTRIRKPFMPDRPLQKSLSILHTEASLGWGGQERRILVEALAMRQRGHRLGLCL